MTEFNHFEVKLCSWCIFSWLSWFEDQVDFTCRHKNHIKGKLQWWVVRLQRLFNIFQSCTKCNKTFKLNKTLSQTNPSSRAKTCAKCYCSVCLTRQHANIQ